MGLIKWCCAEVNYGLGILDEKKEKLIKQAEVAVDLRAAPLDDAHRADERAAETQIGDRKVLYRPRRLRTVVRLGRHLHLAHRIFFGSESLHDAPPAGTHARQTMSKLYNPRAPRFAIYDGFISVGPLPAQLVRYEKTFFTAPHSP
jgi:hypothetical protein